MSNYLKVRCGVRDEGRPFGGGRQGQPPNHLTRLWSKAMVVSGKEKAGSTCQVWPVETNASEPLSTGRKRRNDVKTGGESLTRDKLRGHPAHCLSGIRPEGGVTTSQALTWNVGTW
jgi:hypothetical protein